MEEMQEESLESPLPCLREQSPYGSEDSQFSDSASSGHVTLDAMEANSYGDWPEEIYSDDSRDSINLGVVASLKDDNTSNESIRQESMTLPRNDSGENTNASDETLEENNNDPNNNMDSIEDAGSSFDDFVITIPVLSIPDIVGSPKPGCSKDSLPLIAVNNSSSEYDDDDDEDPIVEQAYAILYLSSKITFDSVFTVLMKDPKIAISERKLWDFVPKAERTSYTHRNSCADGKAADGPKPVASSLASNNAASTSSGANSVKRRPADDICTVGCKKSSSDPNMLVSMPKPVSSPSKIPILSHVPVSAASQQKSKNAPAISDMHHFDAGSAANYRQNFGLPSNNRTAETIGHSVYDDNGAFRTIREDVSKQRQQPKQQQNHHQQQQKTANEIAQFVSNAKNAIPKNSINNGNGRGQQSAITVALPVNNGNGGIQKVHVNTQQQQHYQDDQQQKRSVNEVAPSVNNGQGAVPKARPITTQQQHHHHQHNQQHQQKRSVNEVAPSVYNGQGAIPKARHITTQQHHQHDQPQQKRSYNNIPASVYNGNGAIPKAKAKKRAQFYDEMYKSGINMLEQQQQQPQKRSLNQFETFANDRKGVAIKVDIIAHQQQHHQQQKQRVATAAAPVTVPLYRQTHPPIIQSAAMQAVNQTNRVPTAAASTRTLPSVQQAHNPQQQQQKQQQQQQQQQLQDTERVVCMEMYWKLRNIFPRVDPNYLKKLCPPEWGPGDRDAQLSPLIEHILERGDNIPMIPVALNNEAAEGDVDDDAFCGNVDDIYETLLGIFPDADPHYLRDFAEKNVKRPNAVKEFVDSKFESRNYPTREEYLAKLKITEQQKQYTTHFNVKQYLTIIPDPFKHFFDPTRVCRQSTVALEFLKSHFNKLRVTDISRYYRQYRENLSLTADALENWNHEMKTRRISLEMPTEDISLLQEIAFIKHKAEIREYMQNLKRAEEAEFNRLKEENMLLECQCCYDNECVPAKCSTCDNGHIFCNNCVKTGTSAKMGEDQTRVSCFVNCGAEFSLSVLQQALDPSTFSILLKKRQAAEVIEAGLEGLVSCPFCHFASIPPEEDKVFKCLNPECTKESCRLCKELSHVPFKCGEVEKTDKARRYIEEKMTEALARKCYKCHRAFFKEEGCNKITCHCGAIMCYLCDQPIRDYSHFRGQGSTDQNLCPLYSDTRRLDAVAVRKVAEQAQKEVLQLNPNAKIDATSLLPNIPPPIRGPHAEVLNADEFPRHAQRVLEHQGQLYRDLLGDKKE